MIRQKTLSTTKFFFSPNKINSSEKAKLHRWGQWKTSFAWKSFQNFCTVTHSQNKCSKLSTSTAQKVHTESSTILHRCRYLRVGSILCNNLVWNHLNWLSVVILEGCEKIEFQLRLTKTLFHFCTAVGWVFEF